MAGLPRKERASARKPRVVDWLSLREERSHTTTGSLALAWRSLHTIRGTVTPADTTADKSELESALQTAVAEDDLAGLLKAAGVAQVRILGRHLCRGMGKPTI